MRPAGPKGRKLAMANFAAETLRALQTLQEVKIRTEEHADIAVTIWIVVADEEVYVRSVRGPKGRWYQDLKAGGPATLEFQGKRVPVQAAPVADAQSVERASREYLAKYQSSPYAKPMVRADVLPTTLRLEPRSDNPPSRTGDG
jgi:hypothetical protein